MRQPISAVQLGDPIVLYFSIQTEMYGVSSSCEASVNGFAYNNLDFLDSLPLGSDDQQESEEQATKEESSDEAPSISLTITNVVCMANMRCHLRLKDLARSSVNVEYKALQNVSYHCCIATVVKQV